MASATAVQSPHKCMSACIEQNSPSLVIPPRIAFSAIESMSCRRIQFFVDGSISTLKGLPQPSHSNAARITEMLMRVTPDSLPHDQPVSGHRTQRPGWSGLRGSSCGESGVPFRLRFRHWPAQAVRGCEPDFSAFRGRTLRLSPNPAQPLDKGALHGYGAEGLGGDGEVSLCMRHTQPDRKST